MNTVRYERNVMGAVFLIFSVLILPHSVWAQIAPPPSLPSVSVSDACTVTDTDGNPHSYSGQFLGICALAAAQSQGAVTGFTLQNFAFGLFLQTLNGIAPGETEFWALYYNGSESFVGLTDLTISEGDIIGFQLTDWSSSTLIGDPVQFQIGSLVSSASEPASTATRSSIKIIAPDFNVPKAIAFLLAAQNPDGSMSSWLLSDWTAFALASYGSGDMEKLREHFRHSSPTMTNATDYERHAMALLALGMNPYSETGVDYIHPIVDAFDGIQVGDTALINDDIFALFPLLHAGYVKTDNMIETIKSGILRAQKTDGSWEGSVDLTASAVQALVLFPRDGEVEMAIDRADGFLASKQQDDGGFGNSFSTAWTMQAIAGIGDSHTVWTKSLYHTPRYYLSKLQQADGGVEPADTALNTRLWATAYAIPGVLGKTWDSMLASFPKPQPIAATIPDIATTTPESVTISAVETTEESIPEEEEEVEQVPEPEETSDVASTTINQVAAAGSIGLNEAAAGIAALFSLLLLLAILYSLLRGKSARFEVAGR